MIKPMIAQREDKLKTLQYPAIIEKKYDGYRAFVIREGVSTKVFSARDYKDETEMEHISILLKEFRSLPEGVYDGEVYNPRYPGQAAARTSANKFELKFCVFDLPEINSPYQHRSKALLLRILLSIASSNGKIHPPLNYGITSNSSNLKAVVNKTLEENTQDGLQIIEGVILKPLDSKYEPGERKHWIKIKRKI